ncbi:Nonribosomal peptide synthetase 1 [Cercospora beticola]|uniref:Nonribosomal peptide synthetase 1 n=1 Tax=Cercospora beticola TaxID=122368 RepID=A0A2G5IAV8_CERBT|nr:Nonribosomal peptide synthetase 1 [Cercospora beticola]PIB01977.1 Nonribosomal peptide synthetase 1 [Cercospora beticola]WPA95404.1 hypothetical protein RHO25_000003 [Cercospora beticola]
MAAHSKINDCRFSIASSNESHSSSEDQIFRGGPKSSGGLITCYARDGISSTELILTAWALFLRSYLATDLIAFASVKDTRSDRTTIKQAGHGTNGQPEITTYSLEIPSQGSLRHVFELISNKSTGTPFDAEHLVHYNTMILFQSRDVVSRVPVNSEMWLGVHGREQIEFCLIVTPSSQFSSPTIELQGPHHSVKILQNLLQSYQHILYAISSQAIARSVGSLEPLTAYDLSQIYHWNKEAPKEMFTTIPGIFAMHAQRRPKEPAICAWDGNMTYAMLDHLSTKLAQLLVQLGVTREVIVPYGFEKSKFAVIATLAILKAGGAFIPLDFNHPEQRLRSIIDRTESRIILASKLTAPSFRFLGPRVLQIDDTFLDSLPEESIASNPLPVIYPNTSAFILLTSGTTGQPKCIVVEHSAVCTLNEAYGEALHLSSRSRVLSFAAYTFDVSTVDMFATLHHGGCICIPSEQDRKNDLTKVIQDFRVNWVDLTPSFALASIPDPKEVPSLETLVLAGEAVERVHVAHFVGRVHRVINCYGPAEAGGCLAKMYCNMQDEPQIVGRPLASARCWIAASESSSRLAPIGAIGELVVEGPALARGYLKDPQKTAAAFFHHNDWKSHAELPGPQRRFYRTGDLVRYTPHGEIEFIGRRDTRVKVRGQSIELTEIEHRLSQHALVEKCLIVFPQSGVHAKKLVAVVQLRVALDSATPLLPVSPRDLSQRGFSSASLEQLLLQQLPPYMIDRKKINDWVLGLSITDSGQDISSPLLPDSCTTPLELNSIVSKILSNGDKQKYDALIGRDFCLANAGIDSVQAVTISKAVKQNYGVQVLVDELIQPDLTIVGLDRRIAALQAKDVKAAASSSSTCFQDEISTLARGFELKEPLNGRRPVTKSPMSHVLLTGATGFLGIEILRQLLCMSKVRKVFIHVRAPDVKAGLERVMTAAKKANWWSSTYSNRLEVWPGDLARPNLGLSDLHWKHITDSSNMGENLDTIMHNGAKVDWNLAYESLRSVNTMSTLQLLEAIARRPGGLRFVYVSGGQALQLEDEDEQDMIKSCAHATGYSQSKVVSEILVRRFARASSSRGHSIHVVKPSFVIGDVQRGIANPDDYLWRLTKAAIQLGTYSRGELKNWLFVADVRTVAHTVCQASLMDATELVVIKVLDGLWMRDFWSSVIQETGHIMVAVNDDRWWKLLASDVEKRGTEHCLWALQDILRPGTGCISATMLKAPTKLMTARKPHITQAIKSNLRYLRDELAFLPSTPSHRAKL